MSTTIEARVVEVFATQRLPLLLGLIAGMVDLIGFLTLGHIFTAHVTGNLVVLASDLARDQDPPLAQILVVPLFMIATGGSFLLAKSATRRGVSVRRALLWVQFLMLVGALTLGILTAPSVSPYGVAAGIVAMIAVGAMGCQFVVVHATLPGVPSTAMMTVNLADAVLLLLDALSLSQPLTVDARSRLQRSAQVLAAFFAGCMIAGLTVPLLKDGAWVLPAALAGAALTISEQEARVT